MWSFLKLYFLPWFCHFPFFVVDNRFVRHWEGLITRTGGQGNIGKREREKWGWHSGVWLGSYMKDNASDWDKESWRGSQLQVTCMKGFGSVHLKNIQVHLPVGQSVYFLMSEMIYSDMRDSLIQLVIIEMSIPWFRKCASGTISTPNCYYITPSNIGTPGYDLFETHFK